MSDPPNRVTLDIEAITLSNLAGGALEQAFQAALADATGIFSEPERYQDKGGILTAKVAIEVEIAHGPTPGMCAITFGLDLRPPKSKRLSRPVLLRDGVFLAEPDREQIGLPFPRALHDE